LVAQDVVCHRPVFCSRRVAISNCSVRIQRGAILSGLLAAMTVWPLESPQLSWRAVAFAQQATRASIHLANTIQAEPGSKARVKIEISPRSAIIPNSFVRISGLPHTAGLSEGHVIAPGSWSVSLAGLTGLEIILPAGSEGRSNFSVSLIDIEGNVLAEATGQLVVASAPVKTIGSAQAYERCWATPWTRRRGEVSDS
jgi:hypothetical protein